MEKNRRDQGRFPSLAKAVTQGERSIMITDSHARFTYPDGKMEEITAKAGDVRHFPAFEHLPENLSDKPFEVIGVELKG